MNFVIQFFLPAVLVFMMFSMGLSLEVKDFREVAKFPKAFLVGSFLQVFMLPLVALTIVFIWTRGSNPNLDLVFGLVILSASPGGVTSNMMTYFSKGNTALSVSLTAVISILSIVTLPFVIRWGHFWIFGENAENPIPILKTMVSVFALVTVPIILAMFLRFKNRAMALALSRPFEKLSVFFLVVVVGGAIANKWSLLEAHFHSVGLAVLALNLGTMVTAVLASKLFSLGKKDKIALIFECGFQNGTLAMTIATTFLGNESMMIVAGIYALSMYITGACYWYWSSRRVGQI